MEKPGLKIEFKSGTGKKSDATYMIGVGESVQTWSARPLSTPFPAHEVIT